MSVCQAEPGEGCPAFSISNRGLSIIGYENPPVCIAGDKQEASLQNGGQMGDKITFWGQL
jgi:hypothetical protein